MSSAQDAVESWTEKAQRKFKENPWVPLGCLATTGALVMSAVKMRQGQSQRMNYWLRARVALQGATLVALVGGPCPSSRRAPPPPRRVRCGHRCHRGGAGVAGAEGTLKAALTKEQQRQREVERREFAARMQAAEEVVEMEAGAGLSGMRTVKGPVVKDKDGGTVCKEDTQLISVRSLL
ncbi:altered inheritance of mitochondria protein 31, mitochondrial [Pholiota molesta]|nr:altered inheritance of mitochondria protein 31, mitochondrial [Pholiota molesta]